MEKVTKIIMNATSTPYIPTLHMPQLFMDNQSAVAWTKDAKFQARAKHIELQYYFIRNDMVQRNRLKVQWVAGTDQMADLLTKALPIHTLRKHMASMGLSESL